jgi:hypothetical protein
MSLDQIKSMNFVSLLDMALTGNQIAVNGLMMRIPGELDDHYSGLTSQQQFGLKKLCADLGQ